MEEIKIRTPIFIFVCLLLVIPFTTGQISVAASIMVITNAGTNNPLFTVDSTRLEVVPGQAGEAVFVCDDVQWLNLAGEPGIPWKVMTVLLPPDVNLGSVSAGMANIQYESVIGTWEVLPTSPMMTWKNGQKIVIWPEGKRIVDGYDVDIYGRDAFWPEATVRLLCTGQLRKYQLAQIAVPLVRYNPISEELLKLRETNVAITFDRTVMTTKMSTFFERADKTGKARVQKLAVNFEEVISNYDAIVDGDMQVMGMQSGGGDPNAGYTIITTSAIEANSTKLDDFVTHKESLGFDVQIITETDFGGGTGDTAAENIRQWLKDNYINDNIEYVLLVGSSDTDDGEIPMKMLWTLSVEIYKAPSDYYYADLTGNWDLDGDEYFGEWNGDFGIGGVDRFWEVMVGRIPYYGSISELDAILQKTIDYEYETNNGSTQWRKNVLLPMAEDPNTRYYLGEAIRSEILDPLEWQFHRVYKENYGLVPPPETVPTSYENVTAVWNGEDGNSVGKFGLVVWWSHGSNLLAQDIMHIDYVPDLNDNYPSFTFQASCENSWPEVSNNLSYHLLRNGGICTIGATRGSWPSFNEEFAGTATNAGMAYEYSARIVLGWTCGEALHGLKETLYPKSGNYWMNFTVFNIYGDPALNITNEKSSEKYYVDKDATGGSNDGSSWTDAFTDLQLALSEALPGDEIWVAQGTYLPGTQRTDSFKLVAEVEVYGGYAGLGEIDPNARDIETYETTLSGDIGTPDDPCDNCYHVVIGALDAVLDGFTITGGNANGEPAWSREEYGGGMYCPTSMEVSNCKFIQNNAEKMGGAILLKQNMRLVNCIFSNNTALYGGGLQDEGADITVINCAFNGNYAVANGGGVRISKSSGSILDGCTFSGNSANSSNAGGGLAVFDSNPTVTNCTFIGNHAGYAGAMIAWGGYPTVINCEFIGNWTTSIYRGGGAIYNRENNPNIRNCRFIDNSSNRDGGAVNNHNSNYTLTNCVLSGNSAQNYGGAICDIYECNSVLTNCTITANTASNGRALGCDSDEQQYPSEIQIANCIIWDGGNEIWNNDSSTINVTYSNVKGGWLGEGNIDADPCFADPCSGDYHLQSQAGRWDPNSESWIIDANISLAIDAGDPNSDWTGELWQHGKRINMGAYGGTAEASMSLSDAGNIADLNNDLAVDYRDLLLFTDKWLWQEVLLAADLDRDGDVEHVDFAIFANNWLWGP